RSRYPRSAGCSTAAEPTGAASKPSPDAAIASLQLWPRASRSQCRLRLCWMMRRQPPRTLRPTAARNGGLRVLFRTLLPRPVASRRPSLWMLQGADEEGTHERLKAHHRQLVEPRIKEHRGRIVKTTGDGMLAEFASVVDAVRCAAEIQRGMVDREPDLPEGQ